MNIHGWGPTMEWDTAAGQAVAESAGARVLEFESRQPLTYKQGKLVESMVYCYKSLINRVNLYSELLKNG